MRDQVRAVIFDCFDTLIDMRDRRAEAQDRVRRRVGLPAELAALRAIWSELNEGDLNNTWPLCGSTPPFLTYRQIFVRRWQAVFSRFGVRGDASSAAAEYIAAHTDAAAYPDARSALALLRRRGVAAAVLSNADDDMLVPPLQRLGDHFAAVASSEGLRSYKPHKETFQSVLARLGLAPHQALHVGDSVRADVLGARNAGLPSAWVNRSGQPWPDGTEPPEFQVHTLEELERCLD